jgi:Flp pilus assembly protein TadG
MLRAFIRKLSCSGAQFAKAESGSSAVEFAMVAFPFFYVLGAIFETGLMMFTEYTLQASVQDASRLIRTGQAQKAGMSADAFKAKICETAGIIIDCMGEATVYVNSVASFADLDSATPAMVDIGGGSSASFNAGGASTATSIVVTYDWDFALPFMSFFGNINGGQERRLVGFAMFRNEPYS